MVATNGIRHCIDQAVFQTVDVCVLYSSASFNISRILNMYSSYTVVSD